MAAHKDITLTCGEPWDAQNFRLEFSVGGVVTDLTGYSAKLNVSNRWASRDVQVLTLSSDDGTLEVGGTAGTVAPNLTAQETLALWPIGATAKVGIDGAAYLAVGVYTLYLTDPSGRPARKMFGRFLLSPEATRV